MPLFSVIIPTYNRRELLLKALASVWAQTFTDYEVLVVDDGSTDGTWEELQALGSRVRALRQQNTGPGAARNLGAQHATGDYLAFLDSDDLWFPWTLEVFADFIQSSPIQTLVSGKLFPIEDSCEMHRAVKSPVRAQFFDRYLSAAVLGIYAGSGMIVVHNEAFRRAGGFVPAIFNAEDHDFMLRLGLEPGFVAINSPVTLGRRRHVTALTGNPEHAFVGMWHLVEQEQAGHYPGGDRWHKERRHIIAQHCRTTARRLLRDGSPRHAWKLYLATVPWQITSCRWKFLLGFPLAVLVAATRKR